MVRMSQWEFDLIRERFNVIERAFNHDFNLSSGSDDKRYKIPERLTARHLVKHDKVDFRSMDSIRRKASSECHSTVFDITEIFALDDSPEYKHGKAILQYIDEARQKIDLLSTDLVAKAKGAEPETVEKLVQEFKDEVQKHRDRIAEMERKEFSEKRPALSIVKAQAAKKEKKDV